MPEWKADIQARLAGLRLHPAREAEIIDELAAHLDDRYRELIAAGLPEDEARRTAVAEMRDQDVLAGGLRRLRQAHAADPLVPGIPRGRLLSDAGRDVRYAVRLLRAQSGFAAAAILTLALGIGANTAIFSLVDAMLWQRLPVRDSATLGYVMKGLSGNQVFSYPEYAELRDRNDVFTGLAAWGGLTASLNADGATDLVSGAIVTGNFFDTLGVRAAAGRLLSPADDQTPGAHPVAVISHGLWQRRFGGRSDIAGRPLLLNGQPFTIIGVTPRQFAGVQLGVRRDLYVPMMMQAIMRPPRAGFAGEMNPDLLRNRNNSWLYAIGRLRPGLTFDRAQASMTALAIAIDEAAGRTPPAGAPPRAMAVAPVDADMPGQRAQIVPVATLLGGVVGAVLLIACANVANLMLSRAAARRREVAVRLAIGASRWRLVRQLLSESVVLAVIGGGIGVLMAYGLLAALSASPPPPGPWPSDIPARIDARVLGLSLALSIATGILFGLAPALRLSRGALVPGLRDDSSAEGGRAGRLNLKKTLVVAEVALSLALLIAAGLFVRSLRQAQTLAVGFDVDRLIAAPLNINLLRYTTAQGRQFYQDVIDRTSHLPGAESAAVARVALLGGTGRTLSLQIEGRLGSTERLQSDGGIRANGRETVAANVVSAGFFRTMGIALRGGRDFDSSDVAGGAPVVIVSDAMAARHFPGQSALGQRISVTGPQGPWREIVGVVADSAYTAVGEAATPIVFMPLSQNHETGMVLYVRTTRAPGTLVGLVRQEIQAIEPNLPLPAIQSLDAVVGTSLYPARMAAWLVGGFGVIALLLTTVGVYGVLAYSIAGRTRELGIRVALGARAGEIFALVVKEGMTLVAVGIVVGLGAAGLASRALAGFLYTATPLDLVAFAAGPIVLAIVAVGACLVPARRAMRVDPTVALKNG